MKKIIACLLTVVLAAGFMFTQASAEDFQRGIKSIKFDCGEISVPPGKLATYLMEADFAEVTLFFSEFYEGPIGWDTVITQAALDGAQAKFGIPMDGLTPGQTFLQSALSSALSDNIDAGDITAEQAAMINDASKLSAWNNFLDMVPFEDLFDNDSKLIFSDDLYKPGYGLEQFLENYLRKYNIQGFNNDFEYYYLEAAGLTPEITVTELTAHLGNPDDPDDLEFQYILFGGWNELMNLSLNAMLAGTAPETKELKEGTKLQLKKGLNLLMVGAFVNDDEIDSYVFFINAVPSSEKQLLSFKAAGVSGVIDQSARTISLSCPRGTDLRKVKPELTVSPGATVSPAAGAEVDLTKEVKYTVTAEDGSTAVYTVKATVAATAPTDSVPSVQNPKTGSNSNMFAWMCFVAASLLGISLTMVTEKKRRMLKVK